MKFRYNIEYQNKQLRTVTVVYLPEDTKALSVCKVIYYDPEDTRSALHDRILAEAPLNEWEHAVSNNDPDFDLGLYNGSSEKVTQAISRLYPTPSLEERKEQLNTQIDEWRVRAERRGMPYVFAHGVEDVVQVRHERDLANINGLVSSALVMRERGVTEPVLEFRAASNTTYRMTPQEMIDMGFAVGAFTTDQYRIAWELKELVKNAQSEEELAGIQWPASSGG